jgi:hypothetical protein
VIGALIAATALGGTVGLDRLDLVAPSPWLHDDAQRARLAPKHTALTFAAQVQPVWFLPPRGLALGTSLVDQALYLEHPFRWFPSIELAIGGGIHTRLLLPNGVDAHVALRMGPVRLAFGALAHSATNWADPDWRDVRLYPAGALGFGRKRAP